MTKHLLFGLASWLALANGARGAEAGASRGAAAGPPVALNSAVIAERGPNSRTWVTVEAEGITNHFTELNSGICYQNKDGAWHDSEAKLEVEPGGHAAARKMAYQVEFAPELSSAGSITLTLPDGRRLRSTPRGLAYYLAKPDSANPADEGKSVWIAQVRPNVPGELRGDQGVADGAG